MLFYAMLAGAIVAGLFLTDKILREGLRLVAYYFPSYIAGPDGWLVDTRRRTGIFD